MKDRTCYVNGAIHTMDPSMPRADGFVVDRNRITFVGTSAEVRSAAGPASRIVDLGGRMVLPGFIDNHTHFVQGGTHLQGINLRSSASKDAFITTVREFVRAHRGEWVLGGDWDQEGWEGRAMPEKGWIDADSPDTPVFLQRFDGHMGLANSVALRLAGISAATPDPVGGKIERDPVTGEPTGILKDAAMTVLLGAVPKPTSADITRAVRRALREAASHGVTSIQDITLPDHVPVFRSMDAAGELPCRIYTRLPIDGYRELVREGIRANHGSPFLKFGSLKAFADGSLGSETAWFFEAYEGGGGNVGLAMDILEDGRLREWAIDADRHGLQLSIHAIGDRANDAVLSLFEEIVRVNPPWDRRFRIEHAQHVRPADFPRFRDLGVIVSAQPYHCIDDGVWAERKIGASRARTTYAFKSFLSIGVPVCFGSDWTVAPLDPIGGVYAAVTRRTLDGKRPGGWVPAERVTVREALECYTRTAAYAAFEEREKGSLEPGKFADFVVLSHDLTAIEPAEIRGARVEMTVVDGAVVHGE